MDQIRGLPMNPQRFVNALAVSGYCVVPEAIDGDLLRQLQTRLDECLAEDERRYGREYLRRLKEWGTTRNLANRGRVFIDLLENPRMHPLIEHVLKDYRVLLYTGITSMPGQMRGELGGGSDWHTDVSFYVGSPRWLNVLYMLDDFTPENGATFVLPGSHQRPFPTAIDATLREVIEAGAVQVVAPAGSALVFDSTIWHSAGDNRTDRSRRMIGAVLGPDDYAIRYRFDFARSLDLEVQAELGPLARRLLRLDIHGWGLVEEYYAYLENRLRANPKG